MYMYIYGCLQYMYTTTLFTGHAKCKYMYAYILLNTCTYTYTYVLNCFFLVAKFLLDFWQ